MKVKKVANDINGLIILDKPKNHTSNDCLSIIKKYLHPKKIGHTGTLDENATGVLVCLLGNATKCQEYLMKTGDKVYEAELILGISTDTEDVTGTVIEYDSAAWEKVSLDDLQYVINSFIGDYNQVPPMYSAKKVGGKKLINLARKGVSIERKACKVEIKSIELINNNQHDGQNSIAYDYELGNYKLKKYILKINCSKGTYIRTLCKDIGEKLGIPSCMGNLRRIATGYFNIEDSVSLDGVKKMVENNNLSFIKPCYYQKDDSVITFGKFETLHIGHQKIIKQVVDDARKRKMKSTVLIIGNNDDTKVLSKEQRISKLKYWGIDNIFVFELNESNMKMSPEYFVEEILISQLKAKKIIVGSDCHFGYKGRGDSSLLIDICKRHDSDVEVVDKIKIDNADTYVSSTLVKAEYDKGNFDFVN
ncbi:MAG: tRNA pseudouridine(55) synthase TruB, partial [Lachnospiraceae bacterium]|nr:tRNA pseudouridine(55) synthase TruB [Lachnospiraceae bacterium]